jgi:hypothetical protein
VWVFWGSVVFLGTLGVVGGHAAPGESSRFLGVLSSPGGSLGSWDLKTETKHNHKKRGMEIPLRESMSWGVQVSSTVGTGVLSPLSPGDSRLGPCSRWREWQLRDT